MPDFLYSEIKSILKCFCLLLMVTGTAYAQARVEVLIDLPDERLISVIQRNSSEFLTEINNAFTGKRELRFGRGLLNQPLRSALNVEWAQQKFRIPEVKLIEPAFGKTDGTYLIRNIPALQIRPDGSEAYQEAVLQFDNEGKILDFYFGLPNQRYLELLRSGKSDIDIANREIILTFIDGLSNAYRRKDIGYIRNLFSDQSLIIVGRQIVDSGDRSPYASQVEYLIFDRKEFLNRLTEIFQNNVWIDVKFNDIGILRHPRHPDIYGVDMIQHYT